MATAIRSITMLICGIHFGSTIANSQDIVIDPEVVGNVDIVEIFSEGFDANQARLPLLWSESIARPSTQFIRVRFSIVTSQTNGNAQVRIGSVSEPRAYVQTLEPLLATGTSFWTPPIFARQVEVALLADEPPVGLRIKIDRIAYTVREGVRSSIVGDTYDLKGVAEYSDEPIVNQLQTAVAMLSLERGGMLVECTGFLIDTALLLTNEHCINDPLICPSLSATFGYQDTADGRRSTGTSYQCESLLDFDYATDHALVRLSGNPGDSWGRVRLQTRDASADEALFVIQYPEGMTKQIALNDCLVTDPVTRGRAADTDFAHSCDTLGGSSGSPVFSRTGVLVGLHHYGVGGIHWNENRAIRISRVIQASQLLQDVLADP